MINEYGRVKVEAYIKLWLVNLNDFLNLKHPMTEEQIDFIAETIAEDFRQTSIGDINIIFKNAKKGVYGEFYERLSAPKVVSWFKKYYEDRVQMCAEMSRMAHDRLTADVKKNNNRIKQERRIDEINFNDFKHQRRLEEYKNNNKTERENG